MEQELAYSFHLGSDKNKSKLAKKVAKENLSGTTSISNFNKYKIVTFVMAKLMEMETTEQNKVALYLFNHIKI